MTDYEKQWDEFCKTRDAVVKAIVKQTGWEEDAIGCWYCNYGSRMCEVMAFSCKSRYICNLLEDRYTSKGGNQNGNERRLPGDG